MLTDRNTGLPIPDNSRLFIFAAGRFAKDLLHENATYGPLRTGIHLLLDEIDLHGGKVGESLIVIAAVPRFPAQVSSMSTRRKSRRRPQRDLQGR